MTDLLLDMLTKVDKIVGIKATKHQLKVTAKKNKALITFDLPNEEIYYNEIMKIIEAQQVEDTIEIDQINN